MEITIKLEADERFCQALENLSSTLVAAAACLNTAPPMAEPEKEAPAETAPEKQEAPVPKTQEVPTVPTAPAPVAAPAPAADPAPTYTQDQLAVAASGLVDAGKMTELQALLASFGVPSLVELPKSNYNTFAEKLVEMGAKL